MNAGSGLALILDQIGNIREVLEDSAGFGESIKVGMPFIRLAVHGTMERILSLLAELSAHDWVFNWPVDLMTGEVPVPFYFTGSRSGENYLLAGAESGKASLQIYERALGSANSSDNPIVASMREESHVSFLLNETTRLNNEMLFIQRELAKKNAQLEYLIQEKNRFLGIAAHDLRNPLQTILSAADCMLEEDPAAAGSKDQVYVTAINSSAKFMAGLVDDLLDIARTESGKIELDLTSENLMELVNEAVAGMRAQAGKKNIRISVSCDPMPRAMVDCGKLEQILNNLIGNALKFSEPDTMIEVRLGRDGDSYLLRVRDEGVGISQQDRLKLFTPFQKGRPGTRGEKSVGLGLAIVRRLVEGHSGNIWLESELGKGTTFFVRMPFNPSLDKQMGPG
jgi:two-component system, OmpR family, sensor kinase